MDKRMLSAAFRERLQLLLAEERGGVAGFLRDSGIDRSALSQFRDPKIDRLPRAETPRRMPRRAASPSTGSSAYRTRPRAGRG